MFLLKHLKKKRVKKILKIRVEGIKGLYSLSMYALTLWYQMCSYI